jgi:hypothetical protein
VSALLALFAAAAPGLLLWVVVVGWPRGLAAWSAALGAGYLLGALGLGIALRFAAPWPVSAWFPGLAPWLLLAIAAGGGLLWWQRGRLPVVEAAPSPAPAERGFAWLLLALILFHAVLLAQAVSLPTLAWDAWNAWLGKSRAWVEADALLPLVDFNEWWSSPPESTRYALAPHYPDTLPRFAAWLSSAHGGWSAPAVNLAWPLLWLALGGMLFGHLRLAGARLSIALCGAYLVLSLPLVNAHTALAGYADLWLASLLLLALAHALRAARLRSPRDAAMALLCALLLPAVKLEGAVWLLCLATAAALAWVPTRWRGWLLGGVVLTALLSLPFGGLWLPLPGLGTVRLHWGEIDIPSIGRLPLFWRPVLGTVLESLFLLPNWHLLWYLVPLALLAGWRRLRDLGWLRIGLYFLLGGYAFLFVLFFFTDASAWAENLTSLNRVLLHIVPATVFWLILLLRPRPAIRGRWR